MTWSLAAAAMWLFACPRSVARPPSIILVMADDVGYGDLACLGNPVVETPNLDRFYRESVRFTDFHVSPTSAATRAALLTGRHEFHGGVTGPERERLRLDAVTIAQVLHAAGYATGIFGKWNLGDAAEYQPEKRGFEETFVHGGREIGKGGPGKSGDLPENSPFNPVLRHNGEFLQTPGFSTDVLFRHAVEWMDEQLDAGKPYFACIMTSAARPPVCPPEYERHYLRKKAPPELVPFLGMISDLDESFGMLLSKLEEWGSQENTVVIFLTDHGAVAGLNTFNAGMRGGEGSVYEGGTRVPSFWRWSGHWKNGVEVTALTAHLDLFPTLARLAEAKVPEAIAAKWEGRDLVPLLNDPSSGWPDRVLFTQAEPRNASDAAASQNDNSSVRDQRFSLVNNTELYDLGNDPGQTKNVIGEHPGEVARLRAAYERWWKDVLPEIRQNEGAAAPVGENVFRQPRAGQ